MMAPAITRHDPTAMILTPCFEPRTRSRQGFLSAPAALAGTAFSMSFSGAIFGVERGNGVFSRDALCAEGFSALGLPGEDWDGAGGHVAPPLA